MNRLESITQAYMLATGKTTPPSSGSAKRDLLTNLAIKFYRKWQIEPGVEWESLSRDVSAGTMTATDTFDLDEDIHFISKDANNFVDINGTKYKVVTSAQLNKYSTTNAVAHIVVDGTHSIKFSKAFTASDQNFGQEILVPCIIKLDDITGDTSEILIDDPEWLGERIAAQYAYSFKSLRDMYPDLLDLANETMTGMKEANGSGSETSSTGEDYMATMGNVGIEC